MIRPPGFVIASFPHNAKGSFSQRNQAKTAKGQMFFFARIQARNGRHSLAVQNADQLTSLIGQTITRLLRFKRPVIGEPRQLMSSAIPGSMFSLFRGAGNPFARCRQNTGTRTGSPFRMALSWAQMPAAVMFPPRRSSIQGFRPSIQLVTNS